jgi:hypothetical protein
MSWYFVDVSEPKQVQWMLHEISDGKDKARATGTMYLGAQVFAAAHGGTARFYFNDDAKKSLTFLKFLNNVEPCEAPDDPDRGESLL